MKCAYDVHCIFYFQSSVKTPKIQSAASSNYSESLDRNRLRTYYSNASFESPFTSTNVSSASYLCGTITAITSKGLRSPLSNKHEENFPSPVINVQNSSLNKSLASLPIKQEFPSKASPISLSVPMLLSPTTDERSADITNNEQSLSFEQIKAMEVIQSSSSSRSDFIVSAPSSTFKSTSMYFKAHLHSSYSEHIVTSVTYEVN